MSSEQHFILTFLSLFCFKKKFYSKVDVFYRLRWHGSWALFSKIVFTLALQQHPFQILISWSEESWQFI